MSDIRFSAEDLARVGRFSPQPAARITGPESTVAQGVEPLDNSELRRIANDVLHGVQYSFAAVASNPDGQVPSNSIEADFKGALTAMGAQRRAKATQAAKTVVDADQAVRQRLFGRWGQHEPQEILQAGISNLEDQHAAIAIDHKLVGFGDRQLRIPIDRLNLEGGRAVLDLEGLDEFEDADALRGHVDEQVRKAAESRIHPEKVEEVWGRGFLPDDAYEDPANDFEEFEAATIPDRFSVDVRRVKCIDETNPEFWGSDEIALAGTAIDESGDVTKIGERRCGSGFDDGDQKWLGWNGWHTFDLRQPISLKKGWPKTYRAMLILAEKDNGGLENVLNAVYDKVRDQVKKAIEKAVAEGLKVYLGEVLSVVVGKAVAWVVDKFIGWIIDLFGDDIFPAVVSTMNHVHYNGRFTINGKWGYLYSPTQHAHFSGHGGYYRLEYRWRLHN